MLTRRANVLVLALVLALHMLFALTLWSPKQPAPVDSEQKLVVRLLDDTSAPRTAPPPAPPTLPELVSPQRAAAARHEKPRRDAMVVQDHEAAPAPAASVATPAAISLFNKNGSIRLAPAPTNTSAAVEAKPVKPADDRQIMQHDSNRMHYKATRFEKYFPPPDETAGGAVGRHIGDAIHEIAKSLCDPDKPSTASTMLCGAPPPPASRKNSDARLNLPPPSLVGDPTPITLPLSTCIAEYKDGKPLSVGCPINTPDLAFKAEMRECIDLYRAGRRLKPWCPADTPERAAAE